MDTAAKVLALCRTNNWRIATAESCTGGMVCAALTEVAGSSDVFDRGFVTYSNLAKQQMLGVGAQTLKEFGAVSQDVAKEMALGALMNSNANLSVSITGIAGPGPSEFKPEGRVCFAVALNGQIADVKTVEFGALGRAKVRSAACDYALSLLKQAANLTV